MGSSEGTTEETTGGKTSQSGGKTSGGPAKPNPSLKSGSSGPWGPCDLQSAYNLPLKYDTNSLSVSQGYCPSTASGGITKPSPGSGPTVAIVDAYDDPYAEQDLNQGRPDDTRTNKGYRRYYGLGDCTSSANGGNGCFKKINQDGTDISKSGSSGTPSKSGGWAQETSLDLDMVSASCPDCKILLVEANSNSFSNLATAVNTAAKQPGVVAISNSYGAGESSSPVSTYAKSYDHPGQAVTVSSGDGGYGVEFPADLNTVTAVGGTHLIKDTSSSSRSSIDTAYPYWHESAWSGAGSGCSTSVSQPSSQSTYFQANPVSPACKLKDGSSGRVVADVSAVADPNTAVWVYDSLKYQGYSGWLAFGGTSVASPIIAAVYAVAGGNYTNSYPYGQSSSLYDMTNGSNGSCSGSYLCTAGKGYDGPTGLGTPNGSGAF